MDVSAILLAIVVILAATAVCVMLFVRFGFGAILGFIVAGVLIGPYTPGPVPIHAVDELQSIAELATANGRTTFAVLMAQDMWVVPAVALVPILAHTTNQGAAWSVEQVGVSMTLGGLKNSANKIERGN